MRLIFSLLTLVTICGGGWWAWENIPQIRHFVEEKIHSNEFHTLEIRFTTEQIMENHKKDLLKGEKYTFLDPKLSFFPYLLMEVKYSKDRNTTVDGIILWGLIDGEMVIDAGAWKRTHGYQDCLISQADKNDFNVIRALVQGGGAMDRDRLYRTFNVESEIVDSWVDSCRKKKLVVLSGNLYRLHFADPVFETKPETELREWLVTQPTRHSIKVKNRYTPSQIRKLTSIAFGQDFAIRSMREVFLPIYSISVLNPDGSIFTSCWNAHTGMRLQ